MRRRESRVVHRDHWLDYSEPKFGQQLVNESKILLNIIVLFIPLPLFWALYDQQGSRWVSQGKKMNGDIGFCTLQADQLQAINPLFILIFIPIFQFTVYPMLRLVGIRRPLQKMCLGGILAGCAFLVSMALELKIENSPPNSINLLWQLPQIFIMTFAEVKLFYCTIR